MENRVKCFSVRLASLEPISEKAYRAVGFDGTTAIIPKSQVFGEDLDVQKSEAYWISAWILQQKGLQYSSKKFSFFDIEKAHYINSDGVEVERHIPEEIKAIEVEIIPELRRDITSAEIFMAGKVLTVNEIDQLIGKKIAVTSPEYEANSPLVRIFTVEGVETYYEEASRIETNKGVSLQQLWHTEDKKEAIEWAKNRTVLKYKGEKPRATCEGGNPCLPEGTFFGSDADREVYYIIID